MAKVDGYDIIGDVHGQAGALHELLRRLGYRPEGDGYRYPGDRRQAIFVGDFIDRNPHGRQVLRIVRWMIDAGAARATVGNHEFNAVAFRTPNPQGPDDPRDPAAWLRPRTAKNKAQHQAFLAEVGADSAAHDDAIAFFRTLPLWLDLGELRVIHATWSPDHQAAVSAEAGDPPRLTRPLMVEASREGTGPYAAIECLLKGLEAPLPAGVS